MKILMATSEIAPFARCGSLADTLYELPAALQARGHQVSVALPLYRTAREQTLHPIKPTGVHFAVAVGTASYECEIYETLLPNGVQVFFIRRDEFFDRSGIFGADGRDYQDNSARFIFFAKCVLELARRLNPSPDVIHGHDWPTGMIPVFAKSRNFPIPQVFTVHDLGFQGNFWSYDFGLTNLPGEYFSPSGVEFYGSLNFLKSAIVYADRVIFPSELLVREVQEPGKGCGLEMLLSQVQHKLAGIPPGVDTSLWNPAKDPALAENYSAENPEGKEACKAALLAQIGLDPDPAGPVFAMVTRLLGKKGFDILLPALDRILAPDVRLVILGAGETQYEALLQSASRKHRGRLAHLLEGDESMVRRIYAGSDFLLAPAKLEEGGVRVMQALRYGVVPIVRASGGLRQLVEDYDPVNGNGNGFVFYNFTSDALVDTVRRASEAWENPTLRRLLLGRAMGVDCSWTASAARHEVLYQSLLG